MTPPADSSTIPVWAIEHARAALEVGMHAPEIEKVLVARGLSLAAAAAAVETALETQVGKVTRSRRWADRRKLAHRILSAFVGCAVILYGYWFDGPKDALGMGLCILFPIAFIWFGDEIGYWGDNFYMMNWDNKWPYNWPAPGVVVRIGGWLVLLIQAATVPIVLLLMRR